MTSARLLTLPGWQNSGPAHWQSRWERLHGLRRVEQDDWLWPRRGDWMARLEDELLACEQPAVLVAHSLGCHLVAAWAAHSQHRHRVAAALLVAPPDLDRADMPPQLHTWQPAVLPRLPFGSTVVFSDDDPYCAPGRAGAMAQAWGSEQQALPGAGHINGDSGLGDWPAGLALLQALLQRAGLAPLPMPPAAGPG